MQIPGSSGSLHNPGSLPMGSLKSAHQNAPLDAFTVKHQELENLSDLQSRAGQGRASQSSGEGNSELKDAFDNFVGQTFFSQMLASMRSTQKESAYFHGGQAERIFQGQLDQILTEELSKSSASQISGPMFELFQMRRAG